MAELIHILSLLTSAACGFSTKYPDISDLFNMQFEPELNLNTKPPDVIIKNISVDLEKIDMNQFRKKMNIYAEKFMTNFSNEHTVLNKNLSKKLPSRELGLKLSQDPLWKEIMANSFSQDNLPDTDQNISNTVEKSNDTRRAFSWVFHWTQAATSSRLQVRVKILDLMLQTIYMARYRVKRLESDRFFNAHDTSFRIGFLHKRLRRMYKRVTDILTIMERKKNVWEKQWEHIGPFVILHHKAARVHVDFLYLFRTMMRLHETYEMAQSFPQTIPVDHRANISYWPPTTLRYRTYPGLLNRITPSRPKSEG